MVQLSLIPALEASRFAPAVPAGMSKAHQSSMAPVNRPTMAQISCLKKLTRIRTDTQLARYVSRKLDKANGDQTKVVLTRQDFSKVIEMEVAERRWAS